MARNLLIRGMIAGVIAAVLATLFARLFAEPQVDLAIAFESGHAAMAHAMSAAPEPELVSRATQKGLGLLTAVVLYGAAVGGLFALVFAVAYGRVGQIGPRSLALLLAAGAFVAVALVPALKYPATPPAVGLHETVGFRTLAYFAMIGSSVAALVLSIKAARGLVGRLGAFDAMLAGAALYLAVIVAAQLALPAIDEVPGDFPAVLLWTFRIASLGMQALLWTIIGLVFGALAERQLRAHAQAPRRLR
ncbi:CbtA family protein [Sphingobium sp. AN558]|uniref:CbtA family protein n=1 Tax=Sphingobium sp. AN558 TaxID=3133442 RepID=UPI0030BCEA05